jgi:hypothetical protein
MKYDSRAEGPHSTFKIDQNGRVSGYQEWTPSRDARNPNAFEPAKRFDRDGKTHFDKETGRDVPTPHIQEPGGKVRPPRPDEMPRR